MRRVHALGTRSDISFNGAGLPAPAGVRISAGTEHGAWVGEAGVERVEAHVEAFEGDGPLMEQLRDLVHLHIFTDPLYDQNCYVLRRRDTDRCLVVDPGLQARAAVRFLEEAGLGCDRILLTHGHADHVVGVPAVKMAFGCPAAIHADDRWLLEQTAMFPGIPSDIPEVVCEEDLSAGQLIAWRELEVVVLHTPGHTPGSVSFLMGPDLLAGDTLFRRGVGRTDLPGGSWETLLFSIRERLYALPAETVVHPGHGPATTIGEEMRENPFVVRRGRG